MFFEDFEYDGKTLSGIGYIVCSIDESSDETVPNTTELSLETVSFNHGMRYEMVGATYDDCLSKTFKICKNPCLYNDMTISLNEVRIITQWLSRKQYHIFRILDDDYSDVEYNATFTSISKIYSGKDIVGLELTVVTDKPFAYVQPIKRVFESDTHNWNFDIGFESDEETNIYPKELIVTLKTINANNNTLTIQNDFDGKSTIIKNCASNEIITMNYPIIISQYSGHSKSIQNDFNWTWLRIGHKYTKSINTISVSLPCKIELTYQPIVKLGI